MNNNIINATNAEEEGVACLANATDKGGEHTFSRDADWWGAERRRPKSHIPLHLGYSSLMFGMQETPRDLVIKLAVDS